MLKFKSIAPLVLSNLRNARLQLYSKAASQAEPALSMPDALGAKVEEAPVKPASNPVPVVETSVEQTEKTIAAVETSQKADVTTSSAAAVKKPKGCKQAGGAKGKKGKKCGQPKPPPPPRPPGPPGGNYLEDKCGWYDIPRHNTQKWRKISYALIPFALGLSAIVLATRGEPPEQDYIPYEYMYMRTKRFPWGDGKKSLFHGPYNIIPEEEEERIDREAEEAPPSDKKEGGAGGKEPRYKRSVDEHEEKLKLRDQHAKEELERRKKRHEQEKAKREAKEAEKAKKDAAKAKKNQDAE